MKTLIEGDRAFIPARTQLQCECGHAWQTRFATSPKLATGVRCPKCRSRNISYTDGTRVIPLKQVQKKKSKKPMKTTMAPPEQDALEDVKRLRRPVVSSGITEIEVVTAVDPGTQRKKTLDDLKQRFQKGQGPGELPLDEEAGAVAAEAGTPASILDAAMLDEVFDVETFIVAHEFEVELIAQAMKKDASTIEVANVISTMSRKMQTLLRLIFRDMTIPTAIKVVLFLYAINQLTLVGTIAKAPSIAEDARTPAEEEPDVEELPKKKVPAGLRTRKR